MVPGQDSRTHVIGRILPSVGFPQRAPGGEEDLPLHGVLRRGWRPTVLVVAAQVKHPGQFRHTPECAAPSFVRSPLHYYPSFHVSTHARRSSRRPGCCTVELELGVAGSSRAQIETGASSPVPQQPSPAPLSSAQLSSPVLINVSGDCFLPKSIFRLPSDRPERPPNSGFLRDDCKAVSRFSPPIGRARRKSASLKHFVTTSAELRRQCNRVSSM
jgi:hypothetical protein